MWFDFKVTLKIMSLQTLYKKSLIPKIILQEKTP